MIRRDRLLVGLSLSGLIGVAVLFAAVSWYIWDQSLDSEEKEVEQLARILGQRVESAIVESRDMLARLDQHEGESCSDAHLSALQEAAIHHAHVRAIGFWKAAERLCGVGFVRGSELTPPKADRIYDSGVIAWWPGPQTEIAGVEFFLMRYGAHDVVIDPMELLDRGAIDGRKAGLWVEGLRMAAQPPDAELPSPDSLTQGLTVDDDGNRVISRFSLGTIFPIDIVVVEPLDSLWERHLPTIAYSGSLGLLLATIWVFLIYRVSRRQLSPGAELREAIANGGLEVLYQPVIELNNRCCVGAEALVRWRRESGSLVGPDFFIPIAEKAGLITDMTSVVLHSILDDLGDLIRKHPEIRINLNLAPEDLENPKFFSILTEAIGNARVPHSAIKLEITERALVNSDSARSLIRDLRGKGHGIAIDDFGTGYSSLSYLESFEIDTLKIDKVFVDGIEKNAVTSNVITHVIEIAHAQNLDTVAEGVEAEHQVAWLRRQGVTHGQGFRFSRPLEVGRFVRFYKRHAHRPV